MLRQKYYFEHAEGIIMYVYNASLVNSTPSNTMEERKDSSYVVFVFRYRIWWRFDNL